MKQLIIYSNTSSVEKLYYSPQTKYAKVMFLQVSVCPQSWGGGMHGRGHAWWQGGMCGGKGHAWWWGACMVVGGMHGGGGGMHGGGGLHGSRGACMVTGGCVVAGGGCVGCDEIRSMRGRYASYWNAFLCYDAVYWEERITTSTLDQLKVSRAF